MNQYDLIATITTYALKLFLPALTTAIAAVIIYNISRLTTLSGKARKNLSMLIVVAAIPAILAPIFLDVINLAKVTLAAIMFITAFICIGFIIASPQLLEALVAMEDDASELRDIAMLTGIELRSRLSDYRERLTRRSEVDRQEVAGLVLRSVSPAVMLFLRKERSLVKWGMTAANLAHGLYKYFTRHQQT